MKQIKWLFYTLKIFLIILKHCWLYDKMLPALNRNVSVHKFSSAIISIGCFTAFFHMPSRLGVLKRHGIKFINH